MLLGVVKQVYKRVCCKLKSLVLNLVNLSPAATIVIKQFSLPQSFKVAHTKYKLLFRNNNDQTDHCCFRSGKVIVRRLHSGETLHRRHSDATSAPQQRLFIALITHVLDFHHSKNTTIWTGQTRASWSRRYTSMQCTEMTYCIKKIK